MSINHVTYHAHTAGEDPPERDRLRRRLRLTPPGGRALPDGFAGRRDGAEPGAARGGFRAAA